MGNSKIQKIGFMIFLLGVICAFLTPNDLLWGNEPSVIVTLKDNRTFEYDYNSFFSSNFVFTDISSTNSSTGENKTFGENRLILTTKDGCQVHSISFDNLVEIEVLGIDVNPCEQKKDWLFKVYLLDLEKYEGFLSPAALNEKEELSEYRLKGFLPNSTYEEFISIKDIKKITFNPR